MDYAETNYGFPQFHLPLALIKHVSFCLCFRREAIFFQGCSDFVILPIIKFESG